jgi:hypothetical protein
MKMVVQPIDQLRTLQQSAATRAEKLRAESARASCEAQIAEAERNAYREAISLLEEKAKQPVLRTAPETLEALGAKTFHDR